MNACMSSSRGPGARAGPVLLLSAALVSCGAGDGDAAAESARVVPLPAFATPYGAPGGAAAYEAAAALIDSLTPVQALAAVLPRESPLKGNWSNLPAGIVDFERNGVRLGDLDDEQLARLFDFLAAALGEHGYTTAGDVIAADDVLTASLMAGRLGWSAANYWIAFLGEPTRTGAWGWQFGGHHLAINGSLDGGRVVSGSPAFVGVEPAVFRFAGREARPLGDELEAGYAVIDSLPEPLRQRASIPHRPREVLAGAGKDGVIPPVEGGAVAEWPEAPRALLLAAIRHWVALQPEEHARARMAAIEADVGLLHFAWHGDTEGGGLYYRIQGPELIVEFSTQGSVGAGDGHFHSIYRDPTAEYGIGAPAGAPGDSEGAGT